MKTCWASEFSECAGKISREHYVSKSIFEQQFIYVTGMDWCKGNERKVSIANLNSKILCQHHNNKLSPVDIAGANAIRVFEQYILEKNRSIKTPPDCQEIDGFKFERWLLKIAINTSFKSNMHIGIGMTDSKPGIPSQYLLQVVFGKMRLTHKMGLYLLCYDEPAIFQVGKISMTPICQKQQIGGFLFHIWGFDFFLSLYPGQAPPKLIDLGIENLNISEHLLNAVPVYRKKDIFFGNGENDYRVVIFKWDEEKEIKQEVTFDNYIPFTNIRVPY